MAVALPEEQTEDDEGSEQGDIERPQAAGTMSDMFGWRVHDTHWVCTQNKVSEDREMRPATIVVAS